MLFLSFCQEIAQGVDVIAETFGELSPYGADLGDERIIG